MKKQVINKANWSGESAEIQFSEPTVENPGRLVIPDLDLDLILKVESLLENNDWIKAYDGDELIAHAFEVDPGEWIASTSSLKDFHRVGKNPYVVISEILFNII